MAYCLDKKWESSAIRFPSDSKSMDFVPKTKQKQGLKKSALVFLSEMCYNGVVINYIVHGVR